jgi:hypothetical protein
MDYYLRMSLQAKSTSSTAFAILVIYRVPNIFRGGCCDSSGPGFSVIKREGRIAAGRLVVVAIMTISEIDLIHLDENLEDTYTS